MGKSFQRFETLSIFGYDMRDGRTAAARFARPVGLAVAQDGSLLVADDANGVIYRVAHDRKDAGAVAPDPPEGGVAKP